VGKVALSADTHIPTYRHPLQEGLRHFIFLFQLVRCTILQANKRPRFDSMGLVKVEAGGWFGFVGLS